MIRQLGSSSCFCSTLVEVFVSGAFFEAVILFHGLVIQVFSVYHKQNLVDKGSPAANCAVLNDVSVLPLPSYARYILPPDGSVFL